MRSRILAVLVLATLVVLGYSAQVRAEAEKSADASVSIMSDYMWRGFDLGDEGVIQPTVGITYGGFGANLWSNYDIDTEQMNETDLTLGYSYSLDKLGIDAGYIFYGLDGAEDTQEVYLSASYDVLLSPSLSLYYDFDEGDGAYLEASVGHSFVFANDISLDLGALASYNANSEYSLGDYSDLHHADISASVTVPIGGDFYIQPMVGYSFALSDDAEASIEAVSPDGESDHVYGGITAGLAF